MSDPVLRIKFETGDGKQAAPPIEITIPAGISAKLAGQIIAELVGKRVKASTEAVLKALGIA